MVLIHRTVHYTIAKYATTQKNRGPPKQPFAAIHLFPDLGNMVIGPITLQKKSGAV